MEINNLFDLKLIHKNLLNLRLGNGLYLASVGSFYQKIWVRDTIYCVMPELNRNPNLYENTYHSLLDYYINVEHKYSKFTWLLNEPKNKAGYKYPHPRMTETLDELWEPWGYKQLDCFGEFLYGIWLGESNGLKIIRNEKDREVIILIIKLLESVEYWSDADNGIWEDAEEIHVSSVGACLAGLTAIKMLGFKVNQKLLDEGHNTFNRLLPKESSTKDIDLTLLTLIYPFDIIDVPRAKQIIANTEANLLRERGVIRYKGDMYYNISPKDPVGNEAEWCFGFAYLSLAYTWLGNKEKSLYYLNQLKKCELDGNIPELYYAKSIVANENNPLGWTLAMTLVAIDKYNEKFQN